MASESTEMYLVTVYRLTIRQPETTIRELADQLGLAMSSASEKVRSLTAQGYLTHAWREGVALTALGRQLALLVLRKHRLAASFLVQRLDYRLDEAFEDACALEHAISDRLAERLAALLGNPSHDPYGQPIPTAAGTLTQVARPCLLDIPPGQTVTVCRLETLDLARLGYLHTIGLLPGIQVTVKELVPFEGPLQVDIAGQPIALARVLAAEIGVMTIETEG